MKLNTIVAGMFASAAFALAAGPAQASTYQFTVTGDYSASWQLESTVVADVGFAGTYLTLWDIDGSYPGAVLPLADISFFNADFDGGLQLDDFYGGTVLLATDGPQLYTGDEEGPVTFSLGTFALTQFNGDGVYTLTVTDVSAVPEPASIAMLLGGLGLMGASLRRRSAQAVER
ncbi:MAG: PEP-CTERM sorting domain-containing protein [Betaproteobacteria bacterium]